jgi:hypothetical protein
MSRRAKAAFYLSLRLPLAVSRRLYEQLLVPSIEKSPSLSA